MSWDFWMEIDAGGNQPIDVGYTANYTYNVSGMFYDALDLEGGVREFDGMLGGVAISHLEKAIVKMEEDPKKYEAMNPSNGWGSYDGAVRLLKTLLEWCVAAPNGQLRVG